MGNYATKFLFVLTVTLSISCASSHKIDENALTLSDKKASAETVELYLKLQENLERGIMLGLRCKIGVRRLSGRIRLGHRRHRKREFGQLRLDSIYDPRKLCAQGGTMGRYIGIHLACEQPRHRENRQ